VPEATGPNQRKEVIQMVDQIKACPVLSFIKSSPVPCLKEACAWWAVEACAVLMIAEFFLERRFDSRK
jgi:hypothetical protein